MSKTMAWIMVGFLAAVVLLSETYFVVDETQQVVLTQFGQPVGKPLREAGLYVKIPFIQKVNYLDRRIFNWDGHPNQIPTRDKRYIWVDITARWRIVEPLKFMQAVGNVAAAPARLDDILDAATRDEISNLNLVEAIRDSNRLVHDAPKRGDSPSEESADYGSLEEIRVGREQLTRNILKRAQEMIPNYGIELIDVRIKRINYIQEVLKKVYERMTSERKLAAEKYRSEGQGKKAEIEGQTAKELQEIRSDAYRKAQEIRGTADAEAIRIYSDAYNKDAEFYSFLKSLETMKSTVNAKSVLLLSTESEIFEYLNSAKPDGKNSP